MAISKEKGDLGQSLVMADILKRGYKVLIPLGEDWRFDLVVYKDNKFERIQCKYDGGNSGTDWVRVNTRSCNSRLSKKYTSDEIDWIAIYHEATDKIYYVPAERLGESGKAGIALRITPPKNNQKIKINWASNSYKKSYQK